MKLTDRISLRMRITLLTGALILVVALILTYASMYNAGNRFQTLTMKMVEIVDMEGAKDLEVLPASVIAEPASQITLASITSGGLNGNLSEAVSFTPATLTGTVKRQFDYWSLISMIVVAGAGMAAAWFMAGRALAPVRKLSAATAAIGENDLTTRIAVSGPKDEIGGLTTSFNGMMDRLEESFERQKRFSSNVAHELKTPLATLKMSLQIARMEMPEDIYSVTERSVDRLIGVVDDLLLLTSEGELNPEDSIEPEQMLREITAELEPLYEEKELTVSYSFPTEGSESNVILGERELVRRMFANLIENAMKYNIRGGSLHIAVEERATSAGESCKSAGGQNESVYGEKGGNICRDKGGKVCGEETPGKELAIMIKDSGQGICEEHLKKIFDPFFCVDPSRSRKLGGAGLGLSIALETAQRHGWELTAESVPGKGSTFTVIIPEQAGESKPDEERR